MNHIALLRSTDLLAGVSDSALQRICDSMDQVTLTAGAVLFNQGDPGDAVYVILDGGVKLQRDGVTLVTREAGSWIGEFALIDNEPRSASAVAATDVKLLKWVREEFLRVISQRAEVAYGVFKMLTSKLRQDVDGRVRSAMEQERWRQDLMRAREIQMSMLPQGDLRTATEDISGYCRPCVEVGGDFYDFLPGRDDTCAIIAGDVTGHGFYAGVFVAMAKSSLKAHARFDDSPTHAMEAMRETLALSVQRNLLMRCCYVRIDQRAQSLIYTNAGYPPPYHYRASSGQLERLDALGPPLGVQGVGEGEFHERGRPWERGDLLVIYSDGVAEARSDDGQPWGESRLEACITRAKERSAAGIKESILEALAQHTGPRPYDDDLTLVVARAL